MKRILAIDTCGAVGSVEVFDAATGGVLAQASLPGRETQEKLLPAVERALASAACPPAELLALAVVTGPGSFTGVRIGLAAVKGLGEATGTPVVALSRLAVLANALPVHGEKRLHAWLDAGRGDVYSLVIAAGEGVSQVRQALTSGEEARRKVQEGDSVVVLEPALQSRFTDGALAPLLLSEEDYLRSLRTLARRAVEEGDFADIALLDANYLRIPDAEMALRARSGLPATPDSEASQHVV